MSCRRRDAGFTLVELVVAIAILSMLATTSLTGLLYTLTEARRGYDRAQAAAWVQSELDWLRIQGYGIATSTRTVTQTTGYLPDYGGIAEPRIPEGFYEAEIDVGTVSGMPLKKLTVRLRQSPGAPWYTILSTHVSQFDYP
jgi:prepilin-type N-terminal cleavage/methylation domain-containing protein